MNNMPDKSSGRKFQRKKENFHCSVCGTFVRGTGYTNHCPKCFTSRHVDIAPGDRAANCGGLMPVVEIIQRRGDWGLVQRCPRCGLEKRNRTQPEDDQMALVRLMEELANERTRQI